jgi:hypothetical protein
MAETGPSRSPDELTGETLASLGFEKPALSEQYTWQQLEAAARRFEEEDRDLEKIIDGIRRQQDSLRERARVYREASEIAMRANETDQR